MSRPASPSPHRVVFIAVPPVMTHDLSVAQAVLEDVGPARHSAYRVDVATPTPGLVATVTGPALAIGDGLDLAEHADTVFVIGGGPQPRVGERLRALLRTAAESGRRVVGACTGVFVLAEAGLLDGRRATTHWHVLDRLARDFPQIEVEREALYVDDGSVLTSAGAAAIVELCLHLIRTDHGAAVAAAAGSLVVAGPVRPADQPQPVVPNRPAAPGRSLAATRAWAQARLDIPITLADLAAHAGVSERTLTRGFRTETGTSPLRWLLHQRVDLARQLLETTDLTMDGVGRRSGLGSADSLRRHFVTRLGVPPSAYRTTWRTEHSPSALTTASTPAPRTV
ncbi:transcriptional regulator, AraC family [Catenulispora acidiphila DSM 44928]|uniref:Transcriptional regulator, AraC family n=1 Tax=Catenulispora acidiphila (strain DSM 44928 / JCM 14897 / NBRC 102108 / NRRL B-24433 / ID139908) TaxID=479433 RepID=C7Q557_CATAD|nr:helix-turn-helix domain-containing protein [Catenulispora acidiphila]ACU75826.1 transcriptional regulator, AraC family [Catenulispora acidiphila DSM 44928]